MNDYIKRILTTVLSFIIIMLIIGGIVYFILFKLSNSSKREYPHQYMPSSSTSSKKYKGENLEIIIRDIDNIIRRLKRQSDQ